VLVVRRRKRSGHVYAKVTNADPILLAFARDVCPQSNAEHFEAALRSVEAFQGYRVIKVRESRLVEEWHVSPPL
jgi:hypothetical protein